MTARAVLLGRDYPRMIEVPFPPPQDFRLPMMRSWSLEIDELEAIDAPLPLLYKTFRLNLNLRCPEIRWRRDDPAHASYTMEPAYVYVEA